MLTQTREFDGEEFTVVGGKYFDAESGEHVPLDERPEEAVRGGIEKALRGHPDVLDVVICGFQAHIMATTDDYEEILEVAREEGYRLKKTIDQRHSRRKDHDYSLFVVL